MKATQMSLLPFSKKKDDAPVEVNLQVEAFLQDYSIEVMPRTAEKVEDFILLESGADDGFYLQQETNDLLVTNLIPTY